MENGQVRELVVQRQNMARSIIEEFMVAANQTMVNRLGRREFHDPADSPYPEKLGRHRRDRR